MWLGKLAPPSTGEVAAFRTIRRRRRWVWVLFFTYLPVAGLAIAVNQTLGFVVALLWMAAFGVAGFVHGSSPCPRCGEPCLRKGWGVNPWLLKCWHCKTPLYWSDEALNRPPSPDGQPN